MHLMNCPVCGKRIPMNSPQCPECNFDLTEYIQQDAENAKTRPFKRIISILALVMISLVLIDVGINMWRNSGHVIELPSVPSAIPIPTDMPVPTDVSAPSDFPTPTPTVSTTTLPVNHSDPIGVYNGNDGDTLVINDNGLAYYFCSYIEFTEVECPWEYKDGVLSIQLYKMHCNVYADIENNDFSEILLRGNSKNWNPELFSKLSISPADYMKRNIESNDTAVSVESDGTMTFTMDNLHFSVPKQFRDTEDDLDYDIDTVTFVETDVDSDYISSLLFHRETGSIDENFPQKFMESVNIGKSTKTTLASREATIYEITGSYNTGFSQCR